MFCMLKKKRCILLMFQNIAQIVKNQLLFLFFAARWHYLAVKKLSALLRGITSKHFGDFYCPNCLHFFRIKNKLESQKKASENKDFCNLFMLSEDCKILEFKQYQKSDKAPFIIYAAPEYITENNGRCKNNPESLSTTKVSKHIS